MKKSFLLVLMLIVVSPVVVSGIAPVHMGRVSIDTSLYERSGNIYCVPGPFVGGQTFISGSTGISSMFIGAFPKKNSNQFDLYSYSGKIGTSVVPVIREIANDYRVIFSCYMLDDDAGWESIVNISSNSGQVANFKVFDDDGTELLADSGWAYYGFDGNSTYIITQRPNIYLDIDSWRFRTNISSESPITLSKTKSVQSSFMQIYGPSGGDYRVTLSPSSGNQINFQMFDLLGRCLVNKQIGNLTSPISFTIPEETVPNSPFIAKVNDGSSSMVKKMIPVK